MLIVTTQCFPPVLGGIENLMYSLCVHLYESGHDLRVYADTCVSREDRQFDRALQFQTLRYSGLKPWRRRKKSRDIARLVRRPENHALIADSWKSLEYLDTTLFSRVLCLAHGTELPLTPGKSKAARITHSLNKASVIVANSSYTATRLGRYTGPDNHIQVIHPGINPPAVPGQDTQGLVRQRISGRSPVLISIARLEPRKGLDQVLKMMPRVLQHYPHALYIVAGEGSLCSQLELLAADLNINDHVLFCGRLNEPVKSCFLQYSDLFVLPGRGIGDDIEGFGMAFLEAATHGIPAVAGRSGGAAEAVLHEQTGLVCEAGNPDGLADAVLSLLDDEELRRRLGDYARARSAGFLWKNRIKDYEKLLPP